MLSTVRCALREFGCHIQCRQCSLAVVLQTQVRNNSTTSNFKRKKDFIDLPKKPKILWAQQRKLSRSASTDTPKSEGDTGQAVVSERFKMRPDHIPVLRETVIDILKPQNDQLIVDMTFGNGGHTREILQVAPGVRMLCLDRDPLAFSRAESLAREYPPGQITVCNGKFSDLQDFLEEKGILPGCVDSFLFDVGASSMQFDEESRGFSVSRDGMLDMRMDQDRIPNQPSAMDVVNNLDAKDLGEILKKYGEERKYKLIARSIVDARYAHGKISTTKQLAAIVENCFPEGCVMKDKLNRRAHVATRTFQALRIFVNNELNELNVGIQLAHRYLKEGGLCVAISFHSLEDRIIKRHFHGIDLREEKCITIQQRARRSGRVDGYLLNEIQEVLKTKWTPHSKKVSEPTRGECKANPRSRSAKLRAAYKKETE